MDLITEVCWWILSLKCVGGSHVSSASVFAIHEGHSAIIHLRD